MKIGYARVSTGEQNLNLQLDALKRAGCEHIYTDQGVSGSRFARPGLDNALFRLRPGDTLIVWRLDRLGRSLSRLVDLITHLGKRRVQFASLTEAIDTASAGGTLMFHMMAALAEFERRLISERTRAGLDAARARGTRLGRRRALGPDESRQALCLLQSETAAHVAERFNVHPRTLHRLKKRGAAAE
ncbi:recombinase family protein [Burkholderia sp. 9775_39]|uniref:recombinase family protein n=1 Tax=Burkholderia sp. 9775_39 TaxID=2751185 RepID=UPI0018C4029E|nr:recombinase family protein [Burkholderia sp. 9775_39]MBG0882050.1 recombinase family protein [Burkholderia sp. 9775_39]